MTIDVTGTTPPPTDSPLSACTFRTQTQGGWGANPSGGNSAAFFRENFATVFDSAGLTTTGLSALTVKSGALAGYTVGQVLALANTALGGGNLPSGITISALNSVVDAINNNFVDGNTDKRYLNASSCSGS